ncbi:hypothetical protein N657DRAFT_640808 [Parathielavia appendiculata]|uniref:Cytochrome oxidase c assembly-domain-containing protein n=1 Tax=Parathielavia appendiculata TaxID=2587402 RepID=A0AAN6U5P1_9PEZI|nr:hypothetical protein N657DRAFT_640808 [Parathielavia appendiculata]
MRPTVRLSAAPRSVSDATRFTATMPHASSKAAAPPPRFASPKSGAAPPPPAPAGGPVPFGGGSSAGSIPFETPEQKVARLRAAHRRAKEAQVSKFDRIVDASRRVFDSAHKITVKGLVGFTIIAGVATVYTAVDMMMYNKKRSREWVEAQKKLEADSLEAARLAYMTGKATDEQIALVEEYLEREREAGRKTSFFDKLPSALEPSSQPATESQQHSQQQQPTASVTEIVSWPSSSSKQPLTASPSSTPEEETAPSPTKTGLWAWLTSNLKREDEGPSLSEQDEGAGVRDSDLARAVDDKQAYLRAKAHAALERERENQRQGGPLDRVGLVEGEQGAEKIVGGKEEKTARKGWLW